MASPLNFKTEGRKYTLAEYRRPRSPQARCPSRYNNGNVSVNNLDGDGKGLV
jgi:hypothetical protein